MSNDLLDFDFDELKFYFVEHNLETLTSKTKQLMDRVIAFNSAQLNRQGKRKNYPVTELIDFSMDIENLAREIVLQMSLVQRNYDELKEAIGDYLEHTDDLKDEVQFQVIYENKNDYKGCVAQAIENYENSLKEIMNSLKRACEI